MPKREGNGRVLSEQGCPSRGVRRLRTGVRVPHSTLGGCEGLSVQAGCASWAPMAKEQPALVCVLTPASQGASLSAGATPRTQHGQAEHLDFFPKPACLPARSGAEVLQSPIYNTSHVTLVAAPPALPFSVGPGLGHLPDGWHGLRNPPPRQAPDLLAPIFPTPGPPPSHRAPSLQKQLLSFGHDAWGSCGESRLTRPTIGLGLGLHLHTLTYTCVP